jgi:hypothetical protein
MEAEEPARPPAPVTPVTVESAVKVRWRGRMGSLNDDDPPHRRRSSSCHTHWGTHSKLSGVAYQWLRAGDHRGVASLSPCSTSSRACPLESDNLNLPPFPFCAAALRPPGSCPCTSALAGAPRSGPRGAPPRPHPGPRPCHR